MLQARWLNFQARGCRRQPFFDALLLSFDRLLASFVGIDLRLRSGWKILQDGVAKDAGNGVVVFRCDGVELVVVAAGTGHGEAEQATGEGIDAVGECLGLGLCLRLGIAAV